MPLLAEALMEPLFRVAGKPHIYKRAGFWRISVPATHGLFAREFWYIYFSSVREFFRVWSRK